MKISEKIKQRLKEAGIRYHSNDNIADYIKEGELKELQNEVWGYSSNLETHTVETHVYRLRKKIKDKFGDDVFIQNSQKGYKIN